MHFISELRKRRVFTSALLYLPFAWITTEVLTFLFEKFPVPPWADDLVAAAFVAGFPAFLVLAWTFDIGPEGLTRTSASRAQGVMAILFAASIMAVGTGGLFYQIAPQAPTTFPTSTSPSAVTPVSPEPADNSIAVYLFENLSSDPENAYFSEGMTSELVTRLSQIEALQIAAISQTKQEMLASGLEPDVRYRLEGSVRRSGNKVRIAAMLVDRNSGFTVWSEEFDGELKDVFALQEKTALRIAQALDVELGPQDASTLTRRQTDDPQAYDAFLRGWSLIESLHVSFEGAEAKLGAARGHFQDALTIDPEYAQAIAGLSIVESYAVSLESEPTGHLNLAQEFAEEALTLDNTLPEPHFAMARVLANSKDFSGSVAEYRKVLELDAGNGYAWCELSYVLNTDDPLAAEKAAREAIRFRPAYSLAYINLGAALEKQHRLQEAVDAFQQSLQLDPGNQNLQSVIVRLTETLDE